MSQKNKTVEQMRAEVDALSKAMLLPGVPDDEKKIYTDTIIKINKAIEIELQQRQSGITTPSPSGPGPVWVEQGGPVPPIPTTVIRAGIDRPRQAQQPVAPRAATPPPETPVIAAVITGATKQVVIHWGEGAYDVFTEGEARGRFTTAMRDLSASRMARLGRMSDIPQYTTFSRAVAYYRALTEFWAAPPTAQQLAIAPMGRLKQEIFEMITQAARMAAQQNQK